MYAEAFKQTPPKDNLSQSHEGSTCTYGDSEAFKHRSQRHGAARFRRATLPTHMISKTHQIKNSTPYPHTHTHEQSLPPSLPLYPISTPTSSKRIIRPALLLRPHLLIMRLSMHLLLRLVRRHDFLFAKRTLSLPSAQISTCSVA